MPKLLIVTTVVDTLRAFLLPYAKYFRTMGWTVDGAARGICGDELSQQSFDHCFELSWSRSLRDVMGMVRASAEMSAILAHGQYDLVHVHTPIASFITRWSAKKQHRQLRVKIVYTAHGFHFFRGGNPASNLIFSSLEWLAGRWTDALIVIVVISI